MPPRWHNDHQLLAAVAAKLLVDREVAYVQRIAAGTLAEDKANDALRVYRSIAEEWRALAALEPEPLGLHTADRGGAWPHERQAALERALAHACTEAEATPECFETVGFADAVATLLWWQGQRPSARFFVDLGIEGRRRANADPTVRADRIERASRAAARRASMPSRIAPILPADAGHQPTANTQTLFTVGAAA
jgi:hypothetical protein